MKEKEKKMGTIKVKFRPYGYGERKKNDRFIELQKKNLLQMTLTEKKENEKVEMKEDWESSSKSPLKQSKDLNALENQILLVGTRF